MRIVPLLVAMCGFVMAGTLAHAQDANAEKDKCAKLAGLALPNASITSAKTYGAGTFSGPPQNFTGRDLTEFYKTLPAFCRVVVQARPTSDSNITIEVWMPPARWSGRLQGLGNGGFAGLIDHFELGVMVAKGYAAAATDTGHTGSPIDAGWALGHPEKIADFGHRGIHEMTRVAKLVVQQFYGSPAKHSYFAGCSDGGREALMEAQRYPDDYDGILAGAPANNWTGLLSLAAANTDALTGSPSSFIPPSKIPALAEAVAAACDQADGIRDGILNDPRQCGFNPASIQCKEGEDTDKCLTAPQATALKALYAGLRDGDGHMVHPGYLPGGEEGQGGWGLWITGPAPGKSLMASFANGYFSDMVFDKADWDVKTFKVDRDLPVARQKTAAALDAVNPDLGPFRGRGGKLIMYHGWNDPAIPAPNSVDYFERVTATLGGDATGSFMRLYMVPGMQHCSGGPGADMLGQTGTWEPDPRFNARTSLEAWVEKGKAPDFLIATKITGGPFWAKGAAPISMVMTRLLCPYPGTPDYKGQPFNPKSSESFACTVPKK